MSKTWKIVIIIFAAFLCYVLLSTQLFSRLDREINEAIDNDIISYLITYVIMGMPLLLALFILHSPKQIIASLGIESRLLQGLMVAFVLTLPMLISYAALLDFNSALTLKKIFISCVFAALFEELYFRGFLFGQVYKYTRLGFIPSIVLGALLFGVAHLYQSEDIGALVGIFAITAIGATIFAWLYVEWDYNLWLPIGIHFFMNFYWELFSAGDNALGGMHANIFRLITIMALFVGTIIYKRRSGRPYNISKANLWLKSNLK